MSLQELIDYYDTHPELQEELLFNSWKYWNMELDEMIDELGYKKRSAIKLTCLIKHLFFEYD